MTAEATPDEGSGKTTFFRSSWRVRLLGWYVLLVAVASLTSLLVLPPVLLLKSDRDIDSQLARDVRELRSLAGGIDPATGEPFGTDAAFLLTTFLTNNLPVANETFVTYLDGEPFLRSIGEPPLRLDLDPELSERWSALTRPDRGTVDTDVGVVDYVAVPLEGGTSNAVFVAAFFTDVEHAEAVRPVLWAAIAESIVGVAVAGVLAWMLTSKMVRPLTTLSDTARAVTAEGLSQRVPVSGDDELGRLATTFNEMLDRLDEAFSTQQRFLGDAGHELRTPITVIRGHLELIDRNPDQAAATIQLVTEELDRMARMVDDLLTLAQSERPDFLRPRRIDIDELTTIIQRKATTLGHRNWVLDEVAHGVVELDDQRVTQAVMALADNAVGHTEAGDEIGIGSRHSGRELRLWVRDTGPGVPPEDQPHIFERFRRGASSRNRAGAGLGLAIVASIATAHGGTVELASQMGQGATFTLVLPVAQSQEVIS